MSPGKNGQKVLSIIADYLCANTTMKIFLPEFTLTGSLMETVAYVIFIHCELCILESLLVIR